MNTCLPIALMEMWLYMQLWTILCKTVQKSLALSHRYVTITHWITRNCILQWLIAAQGTKPLPESMLTHLHAYDGIGRRQEQLRYIHTERVLKIDADVNKSSTMRISNGSWQEPYKWHNDYSGPVHPEKVTIISRKCH